MRNDIPKRTQKEITRLCERWANRDSRGRRIVKVRGASKRVGCGEVVGPRATTVFLRWLNNRTKLAKSCETYAAKRGDYFGAQRFEHEYHALQHVLDKARAELGRAKKRQPRPNIGSQPQPPKN